MSEFVFLVDKTIPVMEIMRIARKAINLTVRYPHKESYDESGEVIIMTSSDWFDAFFGKLLIWSKDEEPQKLGRYGLDGKVFFEDKVISRTEYLSYLNSMSLSFDDFIDEWGIKKHTRSFFDNELRASIEKRMKKHN